MRKITQEAVYAFLHFQKYSKGNTQITLEHFNGNPIPKIYLHGNCIAKIEFTDIEINHCGFTTATTKERLNGLPGVCIQQKKGIWYLNGKEMLDGWNKI